MTTEKSNENSIVVVPETGSMEIQRGPDVGTMLAQLVQRIGPDATGEMVAALEKLCDLQIKMDSITAAKNFACAKAKLQAELQSIPATGIAKVRMKQGGVVTYKFPPLDQIGSTVKPICERHGFSYSFEYDVKPIDGLMMATTTFILLHRDGHSERTNFVCQMDEGNELMRSNSQKSSGTHTTSMRRAMIGGLGLTWCDPDTDGVVPEDVETINESELETLKTLLQSVSPDPKTRNEIQARFLTWIKSRFKANSLEEIPRAAIAEVMTNLRDKQKQQSAK